MPSNAACMPITSYADEITLVSIPTYMNPKNEKCDQAHLHTYIPHYWHMPLNKYTCQIAHICPITLLQSIYRPHIPALIHQKINNFNKY